MTKIIQRKAQPQFELQLQADGLSPLMARLLAVRGITDINQLSINLGNILPPNTLSGNSVMAKLLADAIQSNKKLLVVGDYDADGATATAVAVKGLRQFCNIINSDSTIDFLVPNRFEYGYGLTPEIVALAVSYKPDYIITVDNGIASVEGVAAANALGIKVLITDHHLPGKVMPQATCIVNPNQLGCTFLSKHLAGVGVMFYCLLALRAEFRERGVYLLNNEPILTDLLDLVALGTVADLVKLDSNNRILVEQGLRRIRSGVCSKGILALLKVAARQSQSANDQDLGFYVGPRLNAAGRLDDMTLGIQCLLTESTYEASQIAERLQELNVRRRAIEEEMQDSAILNLDEVAIDDQYTISLYQENWHQGVIGILASRIKERYHRPVIVFADSGDGLLKGSGRSIEGLHLRDALDLLSKHQPDLIIKFGGHAMAAGLTIKKSDFELFHQSFDEVVRSLISEFELDSVLMVDGPLDVGDMSFTTAKSLENQVWGQGFASPLFYDEFEVLNQRVLGEKHLKLSLRKDSIVVDAIYFNQVEFLPDIIQAAYQLQTNSYKGTQKVQLNVRYV